MTVSPFYRETLFVLIRLFTDLVWLVRSRILLNTAVCLTDGTGKIHYRIVGLIICMFAEKIRIKCQLSSIK